MSESTLTTHRVELLLAELRAGRTEARGELLQAACHRLEAIARKLKRTFPQVGRWEQTEDVLQNASLRLYQALAEVRIESPVHFFRLAALQIRRELIDLARRYDGPQGLGRNHASQRRAAAGESTPLPAAFEAGDTTHNPERIAAWAEFHEAIDSLPPAEREVTELLWYHELSQQEAAELLAVDERTVRRRWRSARLALHERLQGELPIG
ncbi:MAG TPA: sigma-70 family RNA polymerase sigma factor [Lacipirellulaceae bacterium]|nr:sigma-70 family RNA polymerase sigma factor [Lacipirellulaceae bacterium]